MHNKKSKDFYNKYSKIKSKDFYDKYSKITGEELAAYTIIGLLFCLIAIVMHSLL